MNKAILKDLPAYPISEYQKMIVMTQDTSIHKSACQIPLYMLTDRKIDKDIFLKAMNLEIQRNDCLRLRFTKTFKERKMYFLPEDHLDDIPVWDFRNKTQEEMMDQIEKDSAVPVHYLKGEVFRIRILRAPDGRDGFYFVPYHLIMDLAAVLIFFKDLLQVYDHFEKGTELPAPLYPFEEIQKRDLAITEDKKKMDRQLQHYIDYNAAIPQPSYYAGYDRMRVLNAQRKKKKDPSIRCRTYNLLQNANCGFLRYSLSKEETQRLTDFYTEQKSSLLALVFLGIRLHLSRWNENADDVSQVILVNRRTTLNEKNTGGCMVNTSTLRTYFPNDISFRDALKNIDKSAMTMYRYKDVPQSVTIAYLQKAEHRSMLSSEFAGLITVLPADSFPPMEGWNFEIGSVGLKYYPFMPYVMVQPAGSDGRISFAYMFQKAFLTNEDFELLQKNLMKAIQMGMDDPDISLQTIIDSL